MKKTLLLIMTCLMALTINAQDFVDLGLPSGTKWKAQNESDLYNFDAARAEFGDNLPIYAQCEELKALCKWEWTGNGYKVTGLNGNSIFFPAASISDCNGDFMDNLGGNDTGGFWTSSSEGPKEAWFLVFTMRGVDMAESEKCFWRSVRLVQNP
ncbi:MAG: hypothetical protein J5741_01575 [Bacteroidales bacterium]|nr:hypothetical protein [Bacteroidales bacterium]